MLEVSVNINREQTIAQLHAVRIRPKSKKVRKGTICTYNVMYLNQIVDRFTGEYGCGLDLAIKLLEIFKEKGNNYKAIAIYEMMEKEKE